MKKFNPVVHDSILDLQKDTQALKYLADLVELAGVPTERGGFHFSEWERNFIKSMENQEPPVFSEDQRKKLKEIWQAADLRKRSRPDEQAQNLFSKLSPARQAEMRERAKKVKLPWE